MTPLEKRLTKETEYLKKENEVLQAKVVTLEDLVAELTQQLEAAGPRQEITGQDMWEKYGASAQEMAQQMERARRAAQQYDEDQKRGREAYKPKKSDTGAKTPDARFRPDQAFQDWFQNEPVPQPTPQVKFVVEVAERFATHSVAVTAKVLGTNQHAMLDIADGQVHHLMKMTNKERATHCLRLSGEFADYLLHALGIENRAQGGQLREAVAQALFKYFKLGPI